MFQTAFLCFGGFRLFAAVFARQQHFRPFEDVGDFGGVEFVELPAFEAVGQSDGTEADAHEAADGESLAFKNAAHFAVAALL